MIELSRNITIGQYLPLRSFLHRRDPRVKVLSVGAAFITISFVQNYAALAIGVFFAIVILRAGRLPIGYILRSFRPLVLFLLVLAILQVLFYQASAGQVVTSLWHWGPISISIEGVAATGRNALRLLLLYYFINVLTFTTPLMDLADGIESLCTPLKWMRFPVHELVLVLIIALKFIPLFLVDLERAMKAQTARGVRLDHGNFIRRALNVGALLIPLILGGLQRAEQLAIAMENRGFRSGQRRTKLRLLQFRLADVLTLFVAFSILTGAIVVESIFR